MEVTEVYQDAHETIAGIAKRFGLDVESAIGPPGDRRSFRIYKGAKQIFFGPEEAVREYFVHYEKERPGLFSESLYGAKE